MTAPSRLRLDDGTQAIHPASARDALEALWPAEPDPRWYIIREALLLLDHLAWHPAGTEAAVRKVRLYRRAVRAADHAGGAS